MSSEENIQQKFEMILKDVLKISSFAFTDEMKAKDIPGWNSLNHLMVIVALENGFNIRFSVEEATQAENIGELKSLILKKRVQS